MVQFALWRVGEEVTRLSAKQLCAGPIPARASKKTLDKTGMREVLPRLGDKLGISLRLKIGTCLMLI